MAIVYQEVKEGRTLVIDREWKRTYTRQYRAFTNPPDARTGAKAILAACPIGIGSAYESGTAPPEEDPPDPPLPHEKDPTSRASEIRIEPTSDDGVDWTVTVTYSPQDREIQENPLDRTPEISWDFVTSERILDVDRSGNPIVNTAFDSFDPPLVGERHDPIITVVRNEASFLYGFAYGFIDAINDHPWLIETDTGKWLVRRIVGRSQTYQLLTALPGEEEQTYWQVTYELQYNSLGWKPSVLNQGMRQLNPLGTDWLPIFVKGQPISSPSLLDEDGHVLAPDGTPFYREFDIHPEKDFDDLNFIGLDFGAGPLEDFPYPP